MTGPGYAGPLLIGDSGGQLLVMYHAEPGSESAKALASLATATAEAAVMAVRPRLREADRTGA